MVFTIIGIYCDPDTDWLKQGRHGLRFGFFVVAARGIRYPALLERALIMFLKKEIEAKPKRVSACLCRLGKRETQAIANCGSEMVFDYFLAKNY